MADKNEELLGMSDEEFAKERPPEITEDKQTDSSSEEYQDNDNFNDSVSDETNDETSSREDFDNDSDDSVSSNSGSEPDTGSGSDDSVNVDSNSSDSDSDVQREPKRLDDLRIKEKSDLNKQTSKNKAPNVNYEEFYKQIMAPFKANGKTIQLRSPEEAIQLMQQGANYTRKMQSIAPYRKLLIMLENNGLLDETKLNNLIDLDKKNPSAIKKLVKDSGIDPLDIDSDMDENGNPKPYQAGNYRVTDEEAAFVESINNLKETEDGLQTLQEINSKWDTASKDALWKDPSLFNTVHEQIQSGVYNMICKEVERQKMLGNIPQNVPFLAAYKSVGDFLVQQKLQSTQQRQAVATRRGAPKSSIANSARVRAAAPTRTNTKKVERFINPLELSDEEFLKLKV